MTQAKVRPQRYLYWQFHTLSRPSYDALEGRTKFGIPRHPSCRPRKQLIEIISPSPTKAIISYTWNEYLEESSLREGLKNLWDSLSREMPTPRRENASPKAVPNSSKPSSYRWRAGGRSKSALLKKKLNRETDRILKKKYPKRRVGRKSPAFKDKGARKASTDPDARQIHQISLPAMKIFFKSLKRF